MGLQEMALPFGLSAEAPSAPAKGFIPVIQSPAIVGDVHTEHFSAFQNQVSVTAGSKFLSFEFFITLLLPGP